MASSCSSSSFIIRTCKLTPDNNTLYSSHIRLQPTHSTLLYSMFLHRFLFTCFVVLPWTFFYFAAYRLGSMNGMQNPPDYDSCASFGRSYNLGSSHAIFSESSLSYGSPITHNSVGIFCPNIHSFCFPSTEYGFSHKEKNKKDVSLGESGCQCNSPSCVELAQNSRQTSNKSWLFDYCVIRLLAGGFTSCSLKLQAEGGCKDEFYLCGGSLLKQKTTHFRSKNSDISKTSSLDNSVRPGESASSCLVFFTRCLGLSSTHLILQTRPGGFIVEAKGYATESPFGTQPLSGLKISRGGKLSKNFSLFNPFDETLFVEEISISLAYDTIETEAICSISDFQVFHSLLFPTKNGFSAPKRASKETYVHPYNRVNLGPIIFYPSNRCGWSGSALIRNNFSGAGRIPLRGFGGLISLVLLERLQNADFNLPYTLLHTKDTSSACSQPLVTELYAKSMGDLPLEVKRIRFSLRECLLDGFNFLSCSGFALEPGESTKLLISYQTDFAAAMVHRDLELALATGIFMIPMKASFPYDIVSNCKKTIFWMQVKISLLGLLATCLIFLICSFIFSLTTALGSLDYLCKSDGKTSMLHHNQRKSQQSISGKMMNHLIEASSCRYSNDKDKQSELGTSKHLMLTSENHKQISQFLDRMKASPLGYVMVKTGKEKGRRKKRKNVGAKVTTFPEVSSSQSLNITPSSPLSQVSCTTPKYNWLLSPDVEQTPVALSSVTLVKQTTVPAAKVNTLEPRVTMECCTNISSPKVSYSPSKSNGVERVHAPYATSHSSSVSKSNVTLYARAPGSKLHNKGGVQAQELGIAKYTYDIWGDHFSGLHLLVPKNVTPMKFCPAENNFDSFFVNGPQTLVTNS